MKHPDYELGTITHMGCWTDMRCALGNLLGATLTPSITPLEHGWRVSVRSRTRLSASHALWLAGWFNGAAFAWGASPLAVFPIVTARVS